MRSAQSTPPAALDERIDREVLREILAELEMPAAGLARWLGGVRAYCLRRGGDRRYARLLGLLDTCLGEIEAGAAGKR